MCRFVMSAVIKNYLHHEWYFHHVSYIKVVVFCINITDKVVEIPWLLPDTTAVFILTTHFPVRVVFKVYILKTKSNPRSWKELQSVTISGLKVQSGPSLSQKFYTKGERGRESGQKRLADMQTKSPQLYNVIRCASDFRLLASCSYESDSLFKWL